MGPKKLRCCMPHSHTKVGWISSNGLGGDSITKGQTDGGDNNIPFAFLKKGGDNEHSYIFLFMYFLLIICLHEIPRLIFPQNKNMLSAAVVIRT